MGRTSSRLDELFMSCPRMSRSLVTLLSLTFAALAAVTAHTPAQASTRPAVSLSSYDAALLHDINAARRAYGRVPLRVGAGTTDVAHGWSCAMRRVRQLSHRPSLVPALARHGSSRWRTLGENVGMSGSTNPHALFQAYMHSPEHRANILDRGYRYIGIHTERSRGVSWNTLDFVDTYSTGYGATRVTC
jgi:uncharacterized protein YkwD